MSLDVAPPIDDADDLEQLVLVSEKDHIAAEGKAAQSFFDFRAFSAKHAGQAGESTAFLSQRVGDTSGRCFVET